MIPQEADQTHIEYGFPVGTSLTNRGHFENDGFGCTCIIKQWNYFTKETISRYIINDARGGNNQRNNSTMIECIQVFYSWKLKEVLERQVESI